MTNDNSTKSFTNHSSKWSDERDQDRELVLRTLVLSSSSAVTSTKQQHVVQDWSHSGKDAKESSARMETLRFFLESEVWSNPAAKNVIVFALLSLAAGYLLAFWNSGTELASLILVANMWVGFQCLYPYILSLVPWRIAVDQEADALLHSSPQLHRLCKTILTAVLLLFVSFLQFVFCVATNRELCGPAYWIGIVTDLTSIFFLSVSLAIFSNLSLQTVQLVGGLPFISSVFLSTTFSPGAGIAGLKELRYLFSRFYLWCILPDVQELMEGCPVNASRGISSLYMILSSGTGIALFLMVNALLGRRDSRRHSSPSSSSSSSSKAIATNKNASHISDEENVSLSTPDTGTPSDSDEPRMPRPQPSELIPERAPGKDEEFDAEKAFVTPSEDYPGVYCETSMARP